MNESPHIAPTPRRIAAPSVVDPVYDVAVFIVRTLSDVGHETYIVGGCVRDLLLGRSPKDFDIVTSATPEEIQRLFARTIPIGEQFGVVTVLQKGRQFEVATFRTDGIYSDGRRPDTVCFAGVREDVARRDFTINGLLLNPLAGEIIDYAGGIDDLRRGVIRTIGEPRERFEEDALRLVRAVRFAARLGYRIDISTRKALVELAPSVERVAVERTMSEMEQMLLHASRAMAMSLLKDTDLLAHIVPELSRLATEGASGGAQWDRTLVRLDLLPAGSPVELAWAAALADVIVPDPAEREGYREADTKRVEVILGRLRPQRALVRNVSRLLAHRWAWRSARSLRRGYLRRILRHDEGGLVVLLWNADAESSGLGDRMAFIRSEVELLTVAGMLADGPARPPFTGENLLKAGMPRGRGIGEALAEMEMLWLEGCLDTQEARDRWVREISDVERS